MSPPSNAQYQSGPQLAHTFDYAPASYADFPDTDTSFTWFPSVSGSNGRTASGVAYFEGGANLVNSINNFVDLNLWPDAYNNTMPNIGGSMSFEFWFQFQSNTVSWARIFILLVTKDTVGITYSSLRMVRPLHSLGRFIIKAPAAR